VILIHKNYEEQSLSQENLRKMQDRTKKRCCSLYLWKSKT